MNCSVYTPSFLQYRNSHPHQLSSFRIDDILKTPTAISPTFFDPTTLWSSFAAQILAYSPELLSISTATPTTTSPNDISPSIPNLISPQKHAHHRHQYHPYLSSISRHSPTTKIQHDPNSILTTSTNKNNYQHTLSPLSIKDKIQHQHIDRKDCLSSMIPPSSHHQVPPTSAPAYWPYLYTRCNPVTSNVSRRKGGQIRFSAEQSLQLEKKFEISQYLSPVERKQIAKTLQLSERQIKTWFQNRRAKHRRSAATVTKKDMDKSCSSPQQTDDEEDDDIDIEENVDEEHATSSNSN